MKLKIEIATNGMAIPICQGNELVLHNSFEEIEETTGLWHKDYVQLLAINLRPSPFMHIKLMQIHLYKIIEVIKLIIKLLPDETYESASN